MTTHVASAAIRPAAVLPREAAAVARRTLDERDVSRGGVWNATGGVWQRYDRPWTGAAGSRGGAELLGSIGVIHDQPGNGDIALYKVTLTAAGRQLHFTEEALANEVLGYAGLSLATCSRSEIDDAAEPVTALPRQRTLSEILNTDVGKILQTDVGKFLNADVGKILNSDVRVLLRRRSPGDEQAESA